MAERRRRTFVISGISTGLGAALFARLFRAGEQILGIGRRFTDEQVSASEKNACQLLMCDLSSIDRLSTLSLEAAIAGQDEVIFLCNAAVIEPLGQAGQLELRDLAASLTVNVLAPAAIASAILRATTGSSAKLTFVNISSGAARRSIPGWSAYCAGKSAASAYFGCIAAERPDIKIIELDPGVMDTSMQETIRSCPPAQFALHDDFVRLKEEGKLADPATVAEKLLAGLGF